MGSIWQGAMDRQRLSPDGVDPWGDRDLWIRNKSGFAVDDDPKSSADDFETRSNKTDDGMEVRGEELAREYQDEAVEAFRRQVFEAIAWYAPITFFGEEHWGIYFHEPRFWGFCGYIQQNLPAVPLQAIAKDIFHMLNRHESFHAAVELYALVAHDMGGAPGMASGTNLYGAYHHNSYNSSFGTSGCIEESLATATQFHRPGFMVKGLKALIEHELSTALPGYRDWTSYRSTNAFKQGIFDLTTKEILSQTGHGAHHVSHLGATSMGLSHSAGWWFPPTNPKKLDVYGPIPHYATRKRGIYSRLFAPSVLGSKKMKDVKRYAKQLYGATESKGHSKHSKQLRFPNNVVVPLPTTKGVPNYIVEEIAEAVGKSKQEVLREFGFL